ncbi:unnamed protein product [Owenia fusiformis]|uniref:Uncharacterized protein n=1 Tax=Owenia fusiformis TaxID=6347 RepID=A0A8S4NCK3_OWEFU|nr:unnamed protein product [Owenia fusiformis]
MRPCGALLHSWAELQAHYSEYHEEQQCAEPACGFLARGQAEHNLHARRHRQGLLVPTNQSEASAAPRRQSSRSRPRAQGRQSSQSRTREERWTSVSHTTSRRDRVASPQASAAPSRSVTWAQERPSQRADTPPAHSRGRVDHRLGQVAPNRRRRGNRAGRAVQEKRARSQAAAQRAEEATRAGSRPRDKYIPAGAEGNQQQAPQRSNLRGRPEKLYPPSSAAPEQQRGRSRTRSTESVPPRREPSVTFAARDYRLGLSRESAPVARTTAPTLPTPPVFGRGRTTPSPLGRGQALLRVVAQVQDDSSSGRRVFREVPAAAAGSATQAASDSATQAAKDSAQQETPQGETPPPLQVELPTEEEDHPQIHVEEMPEDFLDADL